MNSLPFVCPYAIVFWVVYVLTFFQEWKVLHKRKPKAGENRRQDRRSYHLIRFGVGFSVAIAFLCAVIVPAAAIERGRMVCFWMGIVFIALGALLRRHCFKMLGGHFRPVVSVIPGQPVIEQGAYRWIRHPAYLAGILLFLGIGLALTNWISITVAFLIPVLCYSYRIHVEEQALLETLGAPYREYIDRSKRLIPFFF
jgi:protein-S-isoprenylcysteine O-methyltransferase Ste14